MPSIMAKKLKQMSILQRRYSILLVQGVIVRSISEIVWIWRRRTRLSWLDMLSLRWDARRRCRSYMWSLWSLRMPHWMWLNAEWSLASWRMVLSFLQMIYSIWVLSINFCHFWDLSSFLLDQLVTKIKIFLRIVVIGVSCFRLLTNSDIFKNIF
jgi:hypothetical protein